MNKTIGINIKIMRKKCGFTQDDIAKLLSVTPQAISKWENGYGLPDITQLVPLAKIFGVTTDSLLGVETASYGKLHTDTAENHVSLLMESSKPTAEKHLSAYTYLRAESDKEPTNYQLMCKCINHGAEISRYADFDGFMADSPEQRDEIFKDCERRNICNSRYCEDKTTVEKSDFAMAWIYIHIKEFDKAFELINRLPSLESNNIKESIMAQLVNFQYGFEREKEVIDDNIRKLMRVTVKEFLYSFEDYAWSATSYESLEMSRKFLGVVDSYKNFPQLVPEIYVWEIRIRKYIPRCFALNDDFERAGNEIFNIALLMKKADYTLTEAERVINDIINIIDINHRERVKNTEGYNNALELINKD